jgi:hypothetical protein
LLITAEFLVAEHSYAKPRLMKQTLLGNLFELGQIVATPGALEAFSNVVTYRDYVTPANLLLRHVTGDWGDIDDEDKISNDLSVNSKSRILSAYTLPDGVKIWIITEWDRSVTTFLLPSEY